MYRYIFIPETSIYEKRVTILEEICRKHQERKLFINGSHFIPKKNNSDGFALEKFDIVSIDCMI